MGANDPLEGSPNSLHGTTYDVLGRRLSALPTGPFFLLFLALFVAFAFEFINGFHDTANAVTTVIYTRTPAADAGGHLLRAS